VAPFIKVTFSILGPLQDLGFAASQFGEQNTKWQITIINSKAFYTKFTALSAPKIDLTSAVCTGNIYPAETSASSFSCVLEISAKVYKYNVMLASQFNAKIKECTNELNVNFLLEYAENKKSFSFPFLPTIKLFCACFCKSLNCLCKWVIFIATSFTKI
jgi:hypothetical protein